MKPRKNRRLGGANSLTMQLDIDQRPPATGALEPLGARVRTPPRTTPSMPAGDGVRAHDAQWWLTALRAPTAVREPAVAELHALLLRGARFELNRRRHTLAHVPSAELDDLAMQAADDALVAVLAKLDTFRGASRFTTWAYKFVLLEAGVKARRRMWQGREVSLDVPGSPVPAAAGPSAQELVEDAETLRAIRDAVRTALTPHQREVFAALALNGVPIDVLAERLTTTRGALYKTLHDARRKLRRALADAGLALETTEGGR